MGTVKSTPMWGMSSVEIIFLLSCCFASGVKVDQRVRELDNSCRKLLFVKKRPCTAANKGNDGINMKIHKNIVGLLIILGLFFSVVPLSAETPKVPHGIAGIVLGTSVDDYPDFIKTNFLKEVVLTDWHGFRKGTVSYGVCKYVDQILKIDMKYQDRSKGFFDKLLKEFREHFGEPDMWNGDSFGVMLVWKWQFTDAKGDRVSLSLQYNGKNSEETIGNVVRLSYPDKIAEERRCFADMCQHSKEKTDAKRREELKNFDWSHLIPR